MSAVRIRPVTPEDLPILFANQADPVAAAMADFSSRSHEAFYAHEAKVAADPETVTAVIEADGEVVGSLGSWPEEGRRYVGYWVGRERWGKGYATEGLRAFLGLVEERPLFAWTTIGNAGSQRVLEKCGFVVAERHETEILYALA